VCLLESYLFSRFPDHNISKGTSRSRSQKTLAGYARAASPPITPSRILFRRDNNWAIQFHHHLRPYLCYQLRVLHPRRAMIKITLNRCNQMITHSVNKGSRTKKCRRRQQHRNAGSDLPRPNSAVNAPCARQRSPDVMI
jgi:hypothetical protein